MTNSTYSEASCIARVESEQARYSFGAGEV
jgi:hypothetical protein